MPVNTGIRFTCGDRRLEVNRLASTFFTEALLAFPEVRGAAGEPHWGSEALYPERRAPRAPGPCLDGGEWSPGPDGPEPWLLPATPPGRAARQAGGGHQDRYEQDLPGQHKIPEERRSVLTKDPVQRAFGLWAPQPRCGLLPDYYSPAMLGLKTDQEVLGELVRTKLPAVAALMDGHGVLWTLVVSRWFICLFVDILPVETVLRIWDCLFNEGSKIIFRVALTLIKQHQAFILEASSVADICERFKEITRGSFVTECHTFMQKIFSEPGSLSMATITRLRESCRARLLAQG
ncbi:growth hormone-regulated TBC protein 1 isoform X6 [Ursus maritimus]|uniref:Growth hormone-regulated TBC protein 1 isoform X6 n=1 Tax=Ursus maritimus TaxID=29073 RepID=A0A8M1FBH4_URSMA|nr:growth hormone-regulated TBC protein 1 isoform X6 [Ursus maritimus]